MAHQSFYETTGHAKPHSLGTLGAIVGILAAIVLIALSDVKAPAQPNPDAAAAQAEDWHGNVRRSHWAN